MLKSLACLTYLGQVLVRIDLGRDPTAGFSGLMVISIVNITGALSDLAPIYIIIPSFSTLQCAFNCMNC